MTNNVEGYEENVWHHQGWESVTSNLTNEYSRIKDWQGGNTISQMSIPNTFTNSSVKHAVHTSSQEKILTTWCLLLNMFALSQWQANMASCVDFHVVWLPWWKVWMYTKSSSVMYLAYCAVCSSKRSINKWVNQSVSQYINKSINLSLYVPSQCCALL